MASKNIFSMLSGSEDESVENPKTSQKDTKAAVDKPKKEKKEKKDDPKKTKVDNKTKEPVRNIGVNPVPPKETAVKQEKSAKEGQKTKGVPAEPHPLDKHSGTGLSKQNVENVKTTKEFGQDRFYLEEEEEEENRMTLEEYYNKQNMKKTEEKKEEIKQVDINKLKQQIKKEGLELVSKKEENVVVEEKKKKNKENDYAAKMNTDHADLLGFRTGFVLFNKRGGGPKKEERPIEEEAQKKEEVVEEPAEKNENEVVEEGAVRRGRRGGRRGGMKRREEGEEEAENEEENEEDRGDRRGRRGGRRGGIRRGGRRGGRGNYGGEDERERPVYQKREQAGKVLNTEDENLFPKLG